MAGRKPIPTMLKLVSGTLRKHRITPDEPQPVGNLLDPPEYFNDLQRTEWVYALDNAPPGLLRRLDRVLFAQWCIASVLLYEAEMAIRSEGLMIEKGGGQRITIHADGTQVKTVRSPVKVRNPWVHERNDAFNKLIKCTSELGFSPTSRSRITLAGGGKKETNRFANNAARRA